ncbi:aminodeoxychorismate lyase [Rickettsia bellii]|uniref:Endolytic murein transglycosylase n=1 Tax=Rickettsia bellii str. RML An4 TaxID=1359193 RepID=A0A0F3QDK7_RICBE|nr:endolytic transglycosylase MltG [Rickettsia bellii]ABV79365.1 Aminodeoxychorismate lyase [Rickettsia bellii OSU 85-389]ARD86773.1 aminodeoxychorismate lyase [Rickettsia bellii]KJV89529.1 yceG-like family protein [Rickettsia bellii str. RML An4]MCC8369787.1 endolytic transglycosylase MltG [Rickettsia endosymbiont of Stiretrus anchorago]
MLKNILKIKFFLATLSLIIFITILNFGVFYIFVPGNLAQTKTIIIEPKLSINQIVTKLYSNKVIKYPEVFKIIAKIYSIKNPLKSGEYIFTHNISPLQTLRVLASGKSVIHKIIVPEGTVVQEVVKKINEETRLVGEIKGIIPEGFLMPSTYFFSYGDQKERIINQMRNLMSNNLDKVMINLSPDSPLKTRLDILTLASIVEKEAGSDAEKPIIAAVFLNRLKKNMKLQADPTTIYALTEGKFKLARALTKKDLLQELPYNTYYIKGLPPGPISCPSLKSLEAVVKPAKTDALFFVVDGKGGHNFSNNLNDHNRFVEMYRKSMIKVPVIDPEKTKENYE